ncbi:MAG: hypothetical protein ABEH88_11760 [Halobacteriales archaeon]
MTRRELRGNLRHRVKHTAWRWNALYPVLSLGMLTLAAVGFATGQIKGIGALIMVPILIFLSVCAALTYLTLLVDARHLRERDDWTVSPWRYVALVVVASGLVLVLELGDWVWAALTLVFVILTAVWNLWYAGRRYQYAAS